LLKILIRPLLALCCLGLPCSVGFADTGISERATMLESKLIEWRRDIHQHPELSNREFRTAELVAEHLRSLDMEVRTGIAHTGVIGILNAGKPGPMVALRADMDALPVTEETGLAFASTVTADYNGQTTGVMHACGHDAHVSILMTVAELLAGMRDQLPGSVMFIFQPAEEGAPGGERGGAELMLEEGIFDPRTPDAVFGLHVTSAAPAGVIGWRAGPFMASADRFEILVRGRQTHGAKPWQGIDPIVVSAQIVLGLQTIASRQVDVTAAPSIVSIGAINGGIRNNIIPDQVRMIGTIRSFNEAMREDIHQRIETTAQGIAAAAGTEAEVQIVRQYPVTVNDPVLVDTMLPTLERIAGPGQLQEFGLITWAEDFSFYAQQAPGMFLHLGVTSPDLDPMTAPANHSPKFIIDESALLNGVLALAGLTVDFLQLGQDATAAADH